MDNNTHVWSQISAADSKISACRSALASIRGVLNECSGTLDGWKENRQKIAEETDLMNIRKKDVFEGKMADELSIQTEDAVEQISGGIAKAELLEAALESQIARLNSTITELQSERTALASMLEQEEGQ